MTFFFLIKVQNNVTFSGVTALT